MKLSLLLILGLPLCALADGGLPTLPYIYVEGKAEMEQPADIVTLRFEIAARHPTQAKANEEVQVQAAKIFALLNDRKIAQDDVVAGDLRSEAEYQGNEDAPGQRRTIVGYVVTRPFAVKVREIGKFPQLVNDLLALGVESLSGIEPGLSDEKKLEDEVREKALANANQSATRTLKAAGMKIDSVFALSPVTFPEIRQRIFGGGGGPVAYAAEQMARKVDPSQYRLAPITISQQIHVIYLISPAK
ncbi:MAG: SIMPL domain-containing protein [Spartobacteria bacterium]